MAKSERSQHLQPLSPTAELLLRTDHVTGAHQIDLDSLCPLCGMDESRGSEGAASDGAAIPGI